MDIFLGIIVGLLVLTLLVILHEFGHFIMARKNGVNVLEFGIGFPPRAIAWIKDPKTGSKYTYEIREVQLDNFDSEIIKNANGSVTIKNICTLLIMHLLNLTNLHYFFA